MAEMLPLRRPQNLPTDRGKSCRIAAAVRYTRIRSAPFKPPRICDIPAWASFVDARGCALLREALRPTADAFSFDARVHGRVALRLAAHGAYLVTAIVPNTAKQHWDPS
jgi:hypothetical protein